MATEHLQDERISAGNRNGSKLKWESPLAVQPDIVLPGLASENPLSIYLQEIGPIPVLTREQEVVLAKRMEQGRVADSHMNDSSLTDEQRQDYLEDVLDGEQARLDFYHANLKLVVTVAKRFVGRGLSLMDLIQEGNIGLQRAIDTFDYKLGNKFSSYGVGGIEQAITRAIANDSRLIRLPVHANDGADRANKALNRFTSEHGREPSKVLRKDGKSEWDLVLDQAGVGDATRYAMRMGFDRRWLPSLDAPVTDTEGKDGSTLGAFIADPHSDLQEDSMDAVIYEPLYADLESLLSPKELTVLKKRFGFEGPICTFEEIGQEFGVTREAVRQMQIRILKKLQKNPKFMAKYEGIFQHHDESAKPKVNNEPESPNGITAETPQAQSDFTDSFDISTNNEHAIHLMVMMPAPKERSRSPIFTEYSTNGHASADTHGAQYTDRKQRKDIRQKPSVSQPDTKPAGESRPVAKAKPKEKGPSSVLFDSRNRIKRIDESVIRTALKAGTHTLQESGA